MRKKKKLNQITAFNYFLAVDFYNELKLEVCPSANYNGNEILMPQKSILPIQISCVPLR